MRYLSVCSGIEAATVAWHPLGWTPAAFSEIEPFPRAVLAHHYPDVPCHGDFTTIGADEYGPIDLLVGGTPCQSFLIAGLRGGLADDRGNLALEFLKLAGRTRPRWIVWENVPGVFSSLSHDAPDPCPPDIDLDASNGPADGEEIVVEDSYDADESHAFACFMAGLQELGYGAAYRVLDAQFAGVPQRRRRVFVVGHLGDWRRAAAVLFERHSLQGHSAPRREAREVAPTIPSRSTGGGGLGTDFDCDGGLNQWALSARHDGSPCDDRGPNVIAIQERAVSENVNAGPQGKGWQEDTAFTLEARDKVQAVAFDTTQITSPANYSNPKPGDPCHPLAAGAHAPAVAYDMRGREGGAQFEGPHDSANIRAGSGGSSRSYVASSAVRRLTPRECERLQGFPDDYSLVPYRGKPAADGPRYKALGNSMAVPVMRWIGQRISMVEAMDFTRSVAA